MKHIKLFEDFDAINEEAMVKDSKYKLLKDTYIHWMAPISGSSALSNEREQLKKGDIITYDGGGPTMGHDDVSVPNFKSEAGNVGELEGTGTWGQIPKGLIKKV